MGWIPFDSRLEESEFLLSAGKILLVCQHFEATCKNIVMWLCLSKALHKKQFEVLSDSHIEYVDELLGLFLGRSIKRLRDVFGANLEPEDIPVIEEARDARNFFCHELTLDLVFAPFGKQYSFVPDVERLRANARRLALGDYVVSRWNYEFDEKEPGGFVDRNAYVNRLETWVLGEFG